MKKRVTIKDLAKHLNISISTVSRALNDHPGVSQKTKNKVKDLARIMNFKFNMHARNFRSKKTSSIVLILPEINMFYHPSLISGVTKTVKGQGYSLIVIQTENDFIKERDALNWCIKWDVDGVILVVSEDTKTIEHIDALHENRIPCIMVDKVIESHKSSKVIIDSKDAAYTATLKLLDQGHRKLIGLFHKPNVKISDERYLGFIAALNKYEIPEQNTYAYFIENPKEELCLKNLADAFRNSTALFCMSDEIWSHTYPLLREAKLSIPDDISISMISDGLLPYNYFPPISHIHDSGLEAGKIAAQMILKHIDSQHFEPFQHIKKCKWKELKSIRKISQTEFSF